MRYWKLLSLLLPLAACSPNLPKKKLTQAKLGSKIFVSDDSLRLDLVNPLHCPIYIHPKADDAAVNAALQRDFPLLMPPLADTLHRRYFTRKSLKELSLQTDIFFGDPTAAPTPRGFQLPFPTGRRYRIMQGYEGGFSHNKTASRYALDFQLSVGDTVCAAADGFVVGVIEGYRHGGNDRRWRDYANFITLYHPRFEAFTQYVHLVKNGSFVAVGDEVHTGQPIGLSGATGFVSGAHLHFNVFAAPGGLQTSLPIDSIGNYPAASLRKGSFVEH